MFKISSFLGKIDINLLIVILISVLLRVSFISTAPSSFSVDEASYAYDAYSILETMRDRYGKFLPFFVRAFDDYRESLYIFILVPFIKIFGLNEFAVRLAAALIGTLTVIVVYYLAKEIFNKNVALWAALFLAISPWHIFFSRICFRAILFPLLFCLGLFFFIRSVRKPKYLPVSALTFGLALYTYPSARVFVPLFLVGLIVIFWKHLWTNKVQTLLSCIIFLPIFTLLFAFWITPEGMARGNETGIETDPFLLIVNYLSYFDPVFLFVKGDPNPRRSITTIGIGELHFFELITVLPGIYFLFKRNSKNWSILFLWLFLYPLPAALTDSAHALRSMVGAPLFSIFSAYGISRLITLLSSQKKVYFTLITSFVVVVSMILFLNSYFIHYSKYTISRVSKIWQYGMKEAISYAETSAFDSVIVSDQFWRPDIYILFYAKYPPLIYQLSPIDPSVRTDYSIGKYQVTSLSKQQKVKGNCLFIIKPEQIKELDQQKYKWDEVSVIKDPGGFEAIKIVTNISLDDPK